MEFNLADLFEGVADAIPDRTALIVGGTRLTYAELDDAANRTAHHLAAEGVVAGEHVGIQLYNGVEYVRTLLACLKIRAVPVNVNYRYVADELVYLYRDADLVALVYDAGFGDRVAEAAASAPKLRHLLSVGGPPFPAGDGRTTAEFGAVMTGRPARRGFPARSGGDLYIIYTGGTTGMPKGVMWRQEDLFFAGLAGGNPGGEPAAAPEDVVRHAAGSGPFVLCPAPPLMHGAAQFASFIGFFQGAALAFIRRFDAADLLDLLEREQVLTVNIVGDAMARPIAEELARRTRDLPSLLVVSSTGAILSGTVRAQLQELLPNVTIMDSYGSTETGFTATGVEGSTPETGLRYRVNAYTNVLGPDLSPVEPGSGEIGTLARGHHIPVGYYKDEEKTEKTFVEANGERWCLAGDMATVDADGTITVFGRGSVCVNSGGEKIYTEEVEAVLKAHPAVFDAVVTGVPDARLGEKVAAVVQPYPGATVTADDLNAHSRTRLAGYKAPRTYRFVDQVFRSPSGKTDYTWARETARGGVGAPDR